MRALLTFGAAVCLLVACSDDGGGLPIGASCSEPAQCESGICGGGKCLDPALDEDSDGLINAVEASLGTDPANADTDGDEIPDGAELGEGGADGGPAADSDNDGRIDAVESAVADCDGDEIPDQDDADDGLDAKGQCTGRDSEGPGFALSPECSSICDFASNLGCEGFTVDACQSECMEFQTSQVGSCTSEWTAVTSCVVNADGGSCPTSDDPFQYLPIVQGVGCDDPIGAFINCAGLAQSCDTAQVLGVGSGAVETVEPGNRASFSVDVGADQNYRAIIAPRNATDVVWGAVVDEEDFCDYTTEVEQNGISSESALLVAFGVSSDPGGEVVLTFSGAAATDGTVYVVTGPAGESAATYSTTITLDEGLP